MSARMKPAQIDRLYAHYDLAKYGPLTDDGDQGIRSFAEIRADVTNFCRYAARLARALSDPLKPANAKTLALASLEWRRDENAHPDNWAAEIADVGSALMWAIGGCSEDVLDHLRAEYEQQQNARRQLLAAANRALDPSDRLARGDS